MKNDGMKNLETRYDNRKSFYGKAKYFRDYGILFLRSYSTDVAAIVDGTVYRLWNGYSATTQRHINEFLLQAGYREYTGKAAWRRYSILTNMI